MSSNVIEYARRELELLQSNPPWGVKVWLVDDDNLFEWMAEVLGLKDTAWENGKFLVSLKFGSSFCLSPPMVNFITIPYHPNIHPSTGRPCIEELDVPQCWLQSYSTGSLLVNLQVLLARPCLNRPVNPQAGTLLRNDPSAYYSVVQQCVEMSLHIAEENTFNVRGNCPLNQPSFVGSFSESKKDVQQSLQEPSRILNQPSFIGSSSESKKDVQQSLQEPSRILNQPSFIGSSSESKKDVQQSIQEPSRTLNQPSFVGRSSESKKDMQQSIQEPSRTLNQPSFNRSSSEPKKDLQQSLRETRRTFKWLSFEAYHKDWQKLGTSKSCHRHFT
ncbi:ubiquitin-conjugating enzyme E2 U-like [Limulus polyphemus]|uniref:Ubiquitin-conjugating enzyme E2 U-like n=1 Tax=Limulus polyphemus TaxID=6850 RepID=A0ABM1S626_LIMPO|nr:ubiquitin-conjugating enzyme E2 U-like [Limulus polyphemus]